jgi:hypothetical protein
MMLLYIFLLSSVDARRGTFFVGGIGCGAAQNSFKSRMCGVLTDLAECALAADPCTVLTYDVDRTEFNGLKSLQLELQTKLMHVFCFQAT